MSSISLLEATSAVTQQASDGFGQLFCAMAGVGWVAGADGVRHELRTGQAAIIARGELHAKGSETGLTALLVQIADLTTTPHSPAAELGR